MGEEILDFLVFIGDDAVFVAAEYLVESIDEVHESCHLLVAHGDVARCLVGYVEVMSLLHQSTDGASHGDYVVVGMGREYDDALREWLGSLRTIGVVGIWLATRPSCDGMLQVVEYLDVGIVG